MVDDEQQRQTASVEDRPDPLGDIFGAFRRRLSETQGPDAIAAALFDGRGVCSGWSLRRGQGALTTASDSVRYHFPAAALLGRIYRNEGNAVDAIDWFERAAAVTAPTTDEGGRLLSIISERRSTPGTSGLVRWPCSWSCKEWPASIGVSRSVWLG